MVFFYNDLNAKALINAPRHSIVEAQHIADEINAHPDACDHFEKNPKDLKAFIKEVNGPENLVWVDQNINNAKGVAIGGKNFATTSGKAVVSS